jgi:hypothetical protein
MQTAQCCLSTFHEQVQSSAGALKQLQGQVLDQKRSVEVAHTGQLEARERLVGEMESTARKAQLVVSITATYCLLLVPHTTQ